MSEELHWYQAQIAETAQVLRRSKEAIDASREILSQFDQPDANAAREGPDSSAADI